MNRLTNSTESIIKAIATPIDVHKKQLIYLKLKSLEDFEEELGIDLSVLFSALKIGVYYFDYENQLIHDYVWLINNYITAVLLLFLITGCSGKLFGYDNLDSLYKNSIGNMDINVYYNI